MPRFTNFPSLYDEVSTLSASSLNKWGYLKKGNIKTGVITWRRCGEVSARINITLDWDEKPILTLFYNSSGEDISYNVELVSIPSNLGIGRVWYFICPATKKRCRKLYNVGKFFLHRDAFPYALYEKQTYSETRRAMNVAFRYDLLVGNVYDEINSKHFKKTYRGKPTRRYSQLLDKLDEAKQKEHLVIRYFENMSN